LLILFLSFPVKKSHSCFSLPLQGINATHETHELAASAKLAAPPNPLSPAKLAAPLDPSPAKVIAPPTPSPAKKVANGGLTKRKRSLDRRAAEDMEQTLQTYLFETTITPMGK
jgi:hypothetical protein